MGDLVCVRIFFSNPWRKNFFQHLCTRREFFFSHGIFFPGFDFLSRFFPSKSVCRIYFSEITLTPPPPFPQKANGRPLTDKFHMFLLWCLIRVKSTLLSEEIYLKSPREDFAQ